MTVKIKMLDGKIIELKDVFSVERIDFDICFKILKPNYIYELAKYRIDEIFKITLYV